jgi:hypothetical protein
MGEELGAIADLLSILPAPSTIDLHIREECYAQHRTRSGWVDITLADRHTYTDIAGLVPDPWVHMMPSIVPDVAR